MAVSDVDLTPTESMARAAERGLQLREEHGRGGTEVGVARARDLKNRKTLSPSTVRRMHSFFSRHAVDKKGKGWESGSEGYPSAGLIAHLLWGGDPGASWAARKTKALDKAEGKSESSRGSLYSPLTVQRYDPDCPDSVCEPTMFSKSSTTMTLGIAAKPAIFADTKNASLQDACWPGYEAVGMKTKDGKRVPNCVPKSESARDTKSFAAPKFKVGDKVRDQMHLKYLMKITKVITRPEPEGFEYIVAMLDKKGNTERLVRYHEERLVKAKETT